MPETHRSPSTEIEGRHDDEASARRYANWPALALPPGKASPRAMKRKANHLMAGLTLIASAPLTAGSPRSEGTPEAQPDRAVLAQVVHDICPKRVAMLGEATHGDGVTVAFKTALVRELIDKCHFNAVFFEASHYDFLEFSRRLRAGEPTTPEMIASAVGGLWKFDREFAPLVPYLFARARAGRVALGGLDDQLGSAGAFFANDAMPTELTGYLDEPRRGECREILRKRIYYQFPNYAAPEHDQVASCLTGIDAALVQAGKDAETRLHREMIVSMTRMISRELLAQDSYIQQRDGSMYLNFRWLAAGLPARSKIIVWGATAHMAKDVAADRHYDGAANLGSLIRRDYMQQSFALGFSALSGSYRYSRSQPDRALAIAPRGSLEDRALTDAGRDAVYRRKPWLKAIGTVPARLLGDDFVTAAWQRALDGVVVFRQQRPPQRTDGP